MYRLMYLARHSGWHVYNASRSLQELQECKRAMLERYRSGELKKFPAFANVEILRVMIVQEIEAEEV